MLKKDITFEDIDGNEVTETFYFNLDRAEMLEMELRFGDKGLEEHFRKVVESNDRGAILDIYRYILSSTVGRRVGKLFVKNEEIRNEFMHGGAYAQMFMDLFNNPNGIIEFFRGVLPNKMQGKYDEIMKSETDAMPVTTKQVFENTQRLEKFAPTGVQNTTQVQLPPGGDGNMVIMDEAKEFFDGLTPDVEAGLLNELFGEQKPKELKNYTRKELVEMPTEEFKKLLGKDRHNVSRGLLNVAFERKTRGIDK